MANILLQMPDLPARRKAVMHAEAVAVRAGQYEAANPITLEQAVLMLCKEDGRWQNAGTLNAKLYLLWRDDHPKHATGLAFDFRESKAVSISVKALPDGAVSVTRRRLTEPGEEIRHSQSNGRILWRRPCDTKEEPPVRLAKNPFAGWLDVALTVEGLKPQLALPPPGDDAA